MYGSDTCRGLASRSGRLISKIMSSYIISTADCLDTAADAIATPNGQTGMETDIVIKIEVNLLTKKHKCLCY